MAEDCPKVAMQRMTHFSVAFGVRREGRLVSRLKHDRLWS